MIDQILTGAGTDYSLEEQWTGKRWVDGKKIYQKTLRMPLSSAVLARRVPENFTMGKQN